MDQNDPSAILIQQGLWSNTQDDPNNPSIQEDRHVYNDAPFRQISTLMVEVCNIGLLFSLWSVNRTHKNQMHDVGTYQETAFKFRSLWFFWLLYKMMQYFAQEAKYTILYRRNAFPIICIDRRNNTDGNTQTYYLLWYRRPNSASKKSVAIPPQMARAATPMYGLAPLRTLAPPVKRGVVLFELVAVGTEALGVPVETAVDEAEPALVELLVTEAQALS